MKHVALRYRPQEGNSQSQSEIIPLKYTQWIRKHNKLVLFVFTTNIICTDDGFIIIMRHGFGKMVKLGLGLDPRVKGLQKEWSLMTTTR